MQAMKRHNELGSNILIVMENCPDCLNALRNVMARLPGISSRSFTLLHCCPTRYYEHGGPGIESKREVESVWEEEQNEFRITERYFTEAEALLKSAGVVPGRVQRRAAVIDNLLDATLHELRQGDYSGIILCDRHTDIIDRLQGKGFLSRFQDIPNVAIWTFDTEPVTEAP